MFDVLLQSVKQRGHVVQQSGLKPTELSCTLVFVGKMIIHVLFVLVPVPAYKCLLIKLQSQQMTPEDGLMGEIRMY